MKRLRKIMVSLLAVLLALTVIPFAAFAAGEDTLEPAPQVVLTEEPAAENPAEEEAPDQNVWEIYDSESMYGEDPYHPYPSYVNRDENAQDSDWVYNQDGLANEECERFRKLREEVAAGKKSLENGSCPETPAEMKTAVFTVDPADFAGETYYVTLPSRRLEDCELLYLMRCFDDLGIAFEPEDLYSRNCVRGYYEGGANRKLSAEESARMATIRHQIARGMLTAEDVHPETECQSMATYFGPFTLYPYRRMTDDELAAFALVQESVWENDPDEVEKAARDFASGIFYLPLSMKLTKAERSLDPYTDRAEGYCLTFTIAYTDKNGKAIYPKDKPNNVYVYLRRQPDNSLTGNLARVEYYPDYLSVIIRNPGKALSPDELTEIGTKWIKDNCKLPGLDYGFKYSFESDEQYNYSRVWADRYDHWALFVEMEPDGLIEYFSAQYMR